MGINYLEYLGEGFRILKLNGYFIIAEVKSRMKSIDSFVNLIAGMGCRILKRVFYKINLLRMNTILISFYSYFKK